MTNGSTELQFIPAKMGILSQFVLVRIQVLSNSGIATILVVFAWKLTGWQDKCLDSKDSTVITALIGGIIGHYCCCNGDTWSSELGVLSDDQPHLITNFKVNISFTIILLTDASGCMIYDCICHSQIHLKLY